MAIAGLNGLMGIPAATVTIGKGGKAKGYTGGHTPQQMQAKAEERNVDVRYPKPDELFIDIDTARDYARFKQLIEMFGRIEPVRKWTESPSASGGQHRHIVVTLTRPITHFERIAFQAMLGSDLKREVLSYERLKTGSNPHPTVFFEPKPGTKPKAKPTGFNCTGCNSRNDFAEANQDDGTYLCYECRDDE